MKYPALIALGAGAALVFVVASKLTKALPAVGSALNPASDKNLAYQGVNSVVQTLTGTPDETLGTWFHKTFSGDDKRVADMLAGPPSGLQRVADPDSLLSTAWNNPMGDLY